MLTQDEAQSASAMLQASLDEAMHGGQQHQGGGLQAHEILFQLIPLLSQLGTADSIEKAAAMAHLRVQLQCRALGLSENALVSPAEELPLALLAGGVVAHTNVPSENDDRINARSPTSQLRFVASLLLDQLRIAELLLQYVIECAHLHKHIGKYRDALRWYRVGLLVANLLRGQDSYHRHAAAASGGGANTSANVSPPPPRRGHSHNSSNNVASSASMIPNDETGLLPFLRAIGDVSLTIGTVDDAIDAYEMARAFSEMKSRISLGATALVGHHEGGGTTTTSTSDTDALLHSHNTRTLEFDAALAVAATLGGQTQTAQTAFHRCEKTLEESSSYRRLDRLVAALGSEEEVAGTVPNQEIRGLTIEERDVIVEQAETAIEILTHLTYCCIAKDSTTQGKKYLERAMGLVVLADTLTMMTPDVASMAAQTPPPLSSVSAAVTALRGDLLMLRGWSYLRRAVLVNGCRSFDDHHTTRTFSDGMPNDDGAASDDCDDDEPTKGANAAAELTSAASQSFAAACQAYRELPCQSDASALITTASWLRDTCCEEDAGRTQSLLTRSIVGRYSPEHPLVSCVGLTVALLRAGYWKENESVLMTHLQVEGGDATTNVNDADETGRQQDDTVANQKASHVARMLKQRADDVLVPVCTFARRCGVVGNALHKVTHRLIPLPSKQHTRHLGASGSSNAMVALQRHVVGAAYSGEQPVVSLCSRHPLLSVLWELSAVACALTDYIEEACECLDLAAGVLISEGAAPLTHIGRSSSPASFNTTSTSPPPALQGRNGGPASEEASWILQHSCAVTERLLKCIRRDDVLLCRRVTPLAAFCFSLAAHRRRQPPIGTAASLPMLPSPLPIDRVEALIAECVRELGLDGVHANNGRMASGTNGTFPGRVVPRIVPLELPGIFLDIAEIRLCQNDSVGCLESCSRAIRLSDERNLLYLLGPLFKPAFQLTTSDVEDRARLLRERQVITFNTASSSASSTFTAPSLSMVVPPASSSSMTTLALALFTLARVHEATNNFSQALLAYHQSYASLEMIGLACLPVAAEAFLGCSRASLHLGNIGDGVMYVDVALELFLTHHASFGEYRTVPLLVELKNAMDHCKRTAECMMEERNYTLALHERRYAAPALNGYPLYL
jgi:hypothetical protein